MKFTISNLKTKNGQTDGRPWVKYDFVNVADGNSYSAFAQPGFTDSFQNGYEFEAETTTKPNPKGGVYRNIQWPKANRSYTPQASEMNDAIKSQLDRMERKIDKLLDNNGQTASVPWSASTTLVNSAANLPFADSPPPTDEDIPY